MLSQAPGGPGCRTNRFCSSSSLGWGMWFQNLAAKQPKSPAFSENLMVIIFGRQKMRIFGWW